MKRLLVIIICFLFTTNTFSQNILIGGMIGFPTDNYAFSKNNKIENVAFGFNVGFEQKLSKSFSAFGTLGITLLDQKSVGDNSTIVPIMAGIKLNMGAGGFLPYLGAEIGYNIVSYNDFLGQDLTLKEPAISGLLGFSLPLTSKISWDIHAKYNLVLTVFRSNSLLSINTGLAFSIN